MGTFEVEASLTEDALVRRRRELKYLLPQADSEDLVERLQNEGPYDQRDGRVTTVYFDRPDREFTRRAFRTPAANVKIRLREYLTPEGLPVSPFIWIEVKEREGATTRKLRFQLHKRLVDPFLEGGIEPAAILGSQGSSVAASEVVEAALQIRALARGPLVAVGAVCYRRMSFDSREPRARMTVDREISYHPPPLTLYGRNESLSRDTMGPPARVESGVVVEVKHREDRVPAWCGASLRGFRPVEYSKFMVLARLSYSEASVA
jgi:hypothetical protein